MESKSATIENGKRVPMEEFTIHFLDGEKKTLGMDRYHFNELLKQIQDNNPVLEIGGFYIYKSSIKYFEI
ncbi:MAG: hypothetical protein K0S47_3972 [Herbinix sp.]|jgi:hypothetical protein|nr:hypothetical protein [Herbinix sp.]